MAHICIYPNPSNNYIHVNLSKLNIGCQNIKAEMYDVLGKPIALNFSLGEGIISIGLTGIPSGIYYLLIKTNENVLDVKKVIITKE